MALVSIADGGPTEPEAAQNASKGTGWRCGEPPTEGYPADRCLRDALETLRPWDDELSVAAALQAWWESHTAVPMRGDPVLVAADLAMIGAHARELPTAEEAVGLTAYALANVAAGRAPNDMDWLRRVVKGIPASSARRLHAMHRGRGIDDFSAWTAGLRYRGDVRSLVAGGKSEKVAQQWLRRHPDAHAPSPGSPWRPERKSPNP